MRSLIVYIRGIVYIVYINPMANDTLQQIVGRRIIRTLSPSNAVANQAARRPGTVAFKPYRLIDAGGIIRRTPTKAYCTRRMGVDVHTCSLNA
jgi:hypothetical protein